MVITMAKLHMADASSHGARKLAWRTQAAWAKIAEEDAHAGNETEEEKTEQAVENPRNSEAADVKAAEALRETLFQHYFIIYFSIDSTIVMIRTWQ